MEERTDGEAIRHGCDQPSELPRPRGRLASGERREPCYSQAQTTRATTVGPRPAGPGRSSADHGGRRQGWQASFEDPLCQSYNSLCVDTSSTPPGGYVGHDEPSLLFKSGRPGSGNDMTYTITLPRDPKKQPNKTGAGGSTWNFQLRPTFWFGLTLCDTQSAPEFTHKCKPDSDANNLVGTNPKARGLHREAPRQRVHGAPVLRPGIRPAVRGVRLHEDAVLRGDDHRQLRTRTRTPASRTPAPATTTSSAGLSPSTGRTSPRAGSPRRRRTRCSPGRSPTRTSPR